MPQTQTGVRRPGRKATAQTDLAALQAAETTSGMPAAAQQNSAGLDAAVAQACNAGVLAAAAENQVDTEVGVATQLVDRIEV